MLKCDFNKVVQQLYRNRTLAWVLSCKFAAYFHGNFSQEHPWVTASKRSSFTLRSLVVLGILTFLVILENFDKLMAYNSLVCKKVESKILLVKEFCK